MAIFQRSVRTWRIGKLFGIALLLITSSTMPPVVQAAPPFIQQTSGQLRLVRLMETDRLGLVNPTALLYVSSAAHFLVATAATPTKVTAISAYEDVLATTEIPADLVSSTLAYQQPQHQLVALRGSTGQLESIPLRPDGLPEWGSSHVLTAAPRTSVIEGVAVAANGTLFLLSNNGSNGASALIQLRPGPEGASEAAATVAPDSFQRADIALETTTAKALRGLALQPQSGHLFTLDPVAQRLYEFAQTGQLVTSYDLAPFGLHTLQGLTFAPSADQTDDPQQLNLYIVDSDNAVKGRAAQPNGRIAELSFTPAPAPIVAAANDVASLIRTVDTSKFSPPSPDPSGVAYIPATSHLQSGNVLLISDAEVDEMPLYAGGNLFETTLAGALQRTYTTVAPNITREPAGMAFNPNNGHLFITDDDNIRPLIEIVPGPDKILLTNDDTFTKFSLRDSPNYGNNDPEGVEYARINGVDTLFIVDGLNSELYVARPGPNGIFDGTDDIVSHYDTAAKGVTDPEGIAYHPQTGTIYLVGNPDTRVAEFTMTGDLIRYVDISAAQADKPAGLTFGPGSNNPTANDLYIVARGVDNDSDSKENDGRMYEFAIPLGGNQPPVVDLGPALAVDWPASATLNGTVTDDGLPAPATLTTNWSKVSGPGGVTFADATALATTAAFTAPGTYTLQLTASDGELTGTGTVIVTATAVNRPPLIAVDPVHSLELTETITVTATITDDGLPLDPGVVTVAWQKVSGPGAVTFGDEASSVTSVRFAVVGIYVIRVRANDGELSSNATVTVTVQPTNTPPNVEAGPDQLIGHGDSAQLSGTVTDDGLPNPPAALTITWSKVAGPGAVTFANAKAVTTTASFTALGTYQLALTASDGKAPSSDQLMITVGAPNQAPVVEAGPNLIGTINTPIALQGTVTDDGVPNPPGQVTAEWTVVNGPGTVTFAHANAASTTATVDQTGIYTLQLVGDDGRLQMTDTMSINVGLANQPPAVVLGTAPDMVTTAIAISLSVTASDDWIPAPAGQLSYAWTAVSGPSTPTFTNPTANATTVRFAKSGQYLMRVTVSDGELSSTADFTVTINAPNFPPQVTVTAPLLLFAPGTLQLSAAVTDDGQPDPNRPLTYQWSMSAGPAPVSFTNPTGLVTQVEFPQTGLYTLTIRASDGVLEGVGTVVITVGTETLFNTYLPIVVVR